MGLLEGVRLDLNSLLAIGDVAAEALLPVIFLGPLDWPLFRVPLEVQLRAVLVQASVDSQLGCLDGLIFFLFSGVQERSLVENSTVATPARDLRLVRSFRCPHHVPCGLQILFHLLDLQTNGGEVFLSLSPEFPLLGADGVNSDFLLGLLLVPDLGPDFLLASIRIEFLLVSPDFLLLQLVLLHDLMIVQIPLLALLDLLHLLQVGRGGHVDAGKGRHQGVVVLELLHQVVLELDVAPLVVVYRHLRLSYLPTQLALVLPLRRVQLSDLLKIFDEGLADLFSFLLVDLVGLSDGRP
eukprot:CAMPEP_0170486988 /NCGR_PEP_ID=MMETSP0208-20121228/5864_1 /TAXON_ID=197538 /ORGANISM="Strombidium inclinatum, Strain S3" /LENGTH=295 /DNA_ID=CAMNT_0010761085 /DNA_START=2500 /DNA_END=3387 /DNA_ORIENTATION=+